MWNHIAFIPLLYCFIYRFIYDEKRFTSTKVDLVVRCCLSASLPHYIIDSSYIIIQVHRYGWCNFGYLLHHLISLCALKELLLLPFYPSFLIIPFTLHCVLLIFPGISYFNYFYFILLLNCLYKLNQEPWKNIRSYYLIFKAVLLVVLLPLIILWKNGCKNNMMNVD